MAEKKYKVYMYTFPNGRVYIGMTKNSVQERRDCGYQHNANLKKAIKEYGWRQMAVDILAECETEQEAFNAEQSMIALHHATDPAFGYNISAGGKSTYKGLKHTQEYRDRMSRLYKGKQFSPETLARMKESHEKERKPVFQLSPNGEKLGRFESLIAAADAVGGYATNISRACQSEGHLYKGFCWAFDNRTGGDEG